MTWTDKFQDISAKNWAGISLLCINLVMLPLLFFSGGSPEYDDGDYPTVELLLGDDLLQADTLTSPQAVPQDAHDMRKTHGVHDSHTEPGKTHEKQIANITDKSTTNKHNVSSHVSNETSAKNQHENTGQKQQLKTPPSDLHARVCYEIGPLKLDDEQIKLQNLVEIKGMFASVKYSRSNENLGYWVFIPPLRSRSLARLKVEELKLNGFNDVVLLTRNEPLNAVSLGVFSDQKNAYKHMLRAQSMGFDAKMDIRYHSLGEMWLSVEVNQGKDLDDEGWGKLIKDYPHVQIHPVNCT